MLHDAFRAPASKPVEPRIASCRLHRASGQAVVTFAVRDVYLGTYGSDASEAEYGRRLGE